MTLLEAHNLPFAGAAILLVFIALAQVIGMGDIFDGADADINLDGDIQADTAAPSGFFTALMSLLGVGRVPFLIWLAVLLFAFAAIGVAGQQALIGTVGAPLPGWLAAIAAMAAALPVTGALSRPLARILPQDETSAVGLGSLVRRDAEIQLGTAKAGSPARAKVIDAHGQPHFVMVEPNDPEATLKQGETVMLVRREGETFFGVQYENPMLALN
ncbi:YqiJ family protein [Erythrobacter sp. SCSIO 43205]|uniref:YqiJ family protein n=1 Tax=Erythrobacter sp. SCSIO 43205 TaxID=2779361 RepID=UPI001CA91737|nr:YqiJ family protein [Erythrobacter sp. SCSIO 43205]UAB78576.1 YqiJ family protein [Erythrobacter sp. SCSIO 43205]